MTNLLSSLPARRKFSRGRQRTLARRASSLQRPLRPLSLRRAARQSSRMQARRAGFRGM